METSTLTLQREQFSKLLGSMTIIENSCTDCDISKGLIRQKTNDRQAIIEINLTSILDGNDLSLSLIKQKIALLRTFELDDNIKLDNENIILQIDDKDYTFVDPLSKMSFRKPIKKFLDNVFIDNDDFSKMIKCTEENLVFSVNVTAYMCKRIKSICEGFQNNVIRCDMSQFNASMKISTTNNENNSQIMDKISLNKEVSPCYFNMISLPFALDINSDTKFSTYQISKDVILCKFEEKFFGIPINIYSQVKVIKAT